MSDHHELFGPSRQRLAGKAAVVTGAASGIGRATARLFAHEGARVVLADLERDSLGSLATELTQAGHEVTVAAGDIGDPAESGAMIRTCMERFGRIDTLVANAGVVPQQTILQATVEEWDYVFHTNGRGTFLTCKTAIEAMIAQDPPGGSIVITSSISGLAGQAGQAIYGPSKYVASGITKHFAVGVADRGIRVNAVAPGSILTEAVQRLSQIPVSAGGVDPEALAKLHPLGRCGEPIEVARAILFLASEDASFITGTILPVDGGYLAQ